MSILVDDRGHEPPLIPYFHPYGVEVESVTMESSDILFAGNGPNDTCTIAIERKRIGDLASSIRSKRLSGFQIDGLMEFDYPMIVVEGIYRPQKGTGVLEVMRNGGFKTHRVGSTPMMYSEVSGFLWNIQFMCGIRVFRTMSPDETAACCVSLYHWFEKPWDKHKAHKGIYAPVPERNGDGHKAGMVRRKPSLAVKIAAQLPGVDQKAWQVGEYFGHDEIALMSSIVNKRYGDWLIALGIKGGKSKVIEGILR